MEKITTFEEFDDFVKKQRKVKSVWSNLSIDDLVFFRSQLKFCRKGRPSGYWGDIIKNEGMNDSELGDFVSSIFDIEKESFEKCLHYFGDGNGNCNPRQFWNCANC